MSCTPAMPVQPPASKRPRRLPAKGLRIVVDALRRGVLDLHPLDPAVRRLGRGAMVFLAAIIILTLVLYYQGGALARNWNGVSISVVQAQGSAEATRSSVSSLALSFAGPIGLSPAALILCLAAISVGWGLALAGARRCAPLAYYLLLLPYGAMLALVAGLAGSAAAWAELGTVMLVAAGLYRPLGQASPAWLWVETLLYTALTWQFFLVVSWLGGSGTTAAASLAAGLAVSQAVMLLILAGYWLFLGLETVDASFHVGRWLSGLAIKISPAIARRLVPLLLVAKVVLIPLLAPRLLPDAIVTGLLLVGLFVLVARRRYDERATILMMVIAVLSTVFTYYVSLALAGNGVVTPSLLVVPAAVTFAIFTAWSVWGQGAALANQDTPLLPRSGRLLLLLGWATLAATTTLLFFAARDDAFESLINRVSVEAVLVGGLPFALYLLINRPSILMQAGAREEELHRGEKRHSVAPAWTFVLLALAIAAGLALANGPGTFRLAQAAFLTNRADALAGGRPEEAERLYRAALAAYPEYSKAHFNLGAWLYNTGRGEEAIGEFQAAVAADPEFTQAYVDLGVALASSGRADEAAAAYEWALELDPKLAYAYNNLGVIALGRGEWAQAESYLHQAIAAAGPDRAEYYENIGRAEFESDRWEEAIAHLNRAVELEPDSPDAYISLGLLYNRRGTLALLQGQADLSHECYGLSVQAYEVALARGASSYIIGTNLPQLYLDMGELDRAEGLARQALDDYPNDANMHNILGIILYQKGDPAAAGAEFQSAKQLDPAYPYAWAGAALLDLQQDKYAPAAAGYEEVLRLGLDRDYVHYNLGLAYAGLGRHKEAIAQFDAVVALTASYADFARRRKAISLVTLRQDEAAIALWKEVESGATAADYMGMGRAYSLRGDRQTAEHYYRLAISAYPGDAAAYAELGLLLQGQNELQEAVTCYRQAVELDPTVPWVYAKLGLALIQLGDIEGAEQACRQALAADSSLAEAHAGLGAALDYDGDTTAAMVEYEAALALDPDQPLANMRIGRLYYEDGRYEEALPFLKRSVAADPSSPNAYMYLGLTYSAMGENEQALTAFENALAVCRDADTCAFLQQAIESLK